MIYCVTGPVNRRLRPPIVDRGYRLIEDEDGITMLNLVVAKGYVGRLLAVARYLERNQPDLKHGLEGIIAAIRTDAVG